VVAILETSTNDALLFQGVHKAVVALTPRVSPEQFTRGSDALVVVFEKAPKTLAVYSDGSVLFQLAHRMSPEQIIRGWDAMVAILQTSTDDLVRRPAGTGLLALAPHLSPAQVTHRWDGLVALLLEASTTVETQKIVGNGLEALAPHLAPEQVNNRLDDMIAVLEQSKEVKACRAASKVVVALSANASPDQATRAWSVLIAELDPPENYITRISNEDALAATLAPRLPPEQVTRGWGALISVLEKITDAWDFRDAGPGLVALAARLSTEQVIPEWNALIAMHEKATNDRVRKATGEALVALVPRLVPELRIRTANVLLKSLHKSYQIGLAEQLAEVGKLLDSPIRDGVSAVAISILLDKVLTRSPFFGGSETYNDRSTIVRAFAESLRNSKSLVRLLSHPGCVEELREVLLQRLEELLFHNGEPVYLRPTVAGKTPPAKDEGSTSPPRRFHNIYDAAKWIEQNWPDFDLETNHPITWRGEFR
jgi:hypothetical protein